MGEAIIDELMGALKYDTSLIDGRGVNGVETVHVDVPSKQVEVRYDPAKLGEDTLIATLDEEGYPVAR